MTKYEQLRILVDDADTKFRIKALNSKLDTDENYISFIARYLSDNGIVPVVHGEWIDRTEWFGTLGVHKRECSVCHTRFDGKPYSRGDGKGSKFCDECGAKMEGITNEN